MVDFIESNLRFSFEPSWEVIKYDDEDCYRREIGIISETKAVDFIGFHKGTLFLIEVKDFRHHRIENQRRLTGGELPVEVAQKVRDSVAGMIGAYRQKGKIIDWKPFVNVLANPQGRVNVIIWLEHDLPSYNPKREKVRKSVEGNSFKKKLKWLNCKVLVCNQEDHNLANYGVIVSNVP